MFSKKWGFMKIGSLISYAETVVKRFGEKFSGFCTLLAQKISSLWSRRPADSKTADVSLKGRVTPPQGPSGRRFGQFFPGTRNNSSGASPSGLNPTQAPSIPPVTTSQQQPQPPVSLQSKKFVANTSGRSASHLPPPTHSFGSRQYGDGTEGSILRKASRPSSRRE